MDSLDDITSDFGREQWLALGVQAAIGAPIIVAGELWGIIAAARTTADEPFNAGAEHRLGDFAALVAQAIANLDARREMAALADEQAALRRVATLVAAGRTQPEILEAVTREVGLLYGAQAVDLVKSEGVPNEVVVGGGLERRPGARASAGVALPPGAAGRDPAGAGGGTPEPRRGEVIRARTEICDRRARRRERTRPGRPDRPAAG